MPKFDGTGPRGLGPRTGRRMGPCGMGFGRGMGCGCGMGFWKCPYCSFRGFNDPKEEEEYLKKYLEYLEEEVKNTKDTLKGLPKTV